MWYSVCWCSEMTLRGKETTFGFPHKCAAHEREFSLYHSNLGVAKLMILESVAADINCRELGHKSPQKLYFLSHLCSRLLMHNAVLTLRLEV